MTEALKDDEGFVWLDSHGKSNYSIIASRPCDSCFLFPDKVVLSGEERPISHLQDAITLLQSWCTSHTPKPVGNKISTLPFHGGVIGFLAFELSHGLETLPKHAKNHIGFPLAGWYAYDASLVIHHQTNSTYITGKTKTHMADFKKYLSDSFKNQTMSNNTSEKLPRLNFKASLGKAGYSRAFKRVKSHLQRGDAYQINLCEHWQAHYANNSFALYQQIRQKMSVPFGAFINTHWGNILSFSPERFIHQDRLGTLTTEPIKGTRARKKCPKEDHEQRQDLLLSTKDRAENTMIVDLMRNDLSSIAKPGTVQVNSLCELHSFPNVHHLISSISAKRKEDLHPIEALLHAFPGGSITGAPKPKVLQWIDQLEAVERSIFTGCIGYISTSWESDSNIAIRTLLHSKDTLHAWAGGGVVIDSELEDEYEELFNKMGWLVKA